MVKSNASFKNLEPIAVSLQPEQYLAEVDNQNPVAEEETPHRDEPWEPKEGFSQNGKKVSNKTHRSKTDPDSRIARKSNFSETYLGHAVSYVMDNKYRIIVGADRNLPNRNADAQIAVELIGRLKWEFKLTPHTLGADKGYATGLFVHWLLEQGVVPHVPIMDSRGRNENGIYPIELFQYEEKDDEFICPQGKKLRYWGIHQHSKRHVYRASIKDCRSCAVKEQCSRSSYRSLSYHIYESSIEIARRFTKRRGYRISQRMRKRIEELFGEAKDCMGLRRMKFRGALYVREQVLLTAAAQNIKRLARVLSKMGPNKEAKTQALGPAPRVFLFLQLIHRWIDFFCWQFRGLPL